MDATTMPSMNSLLSRLKIDYPKWRFIPGDDFKWSSEEQTVYFQSTGNPAYLLHELSHALLDHSTYNRDIDLIKMERDAWDTAADKLAPRYGLTIEPELIQSSLDTYRDWLHNRSTCPECSSTGFQTKQLNYNCLACQTKWRVNEARTCGLKRYKLTT